MSMRPPNAWQNKLIKDAKSRLNKIPFWKDYINSEEFAFHLAIFQPPFLDYVLEGRKTVESRFSSVLCPPHGRVNKGDLLLLKDSGGPIVGCCIVSKVWFYELDPDTVSDLKLSFTEALCAQDPDFWTSREKAKYASLMRVKKPTRLDPIFCDKKDRRGWVMLNSNSQMEMSL